ncbi:MAG TPA: thiol peroxidase [Candidatus Baltobacteraceae bacterium]|nr:thiol peroxidase [Candidatus Baltobacteraceae bacterium]
MNVTFKGQPVTLEGPNLRVGDKAPAFTLTDGELKTVTLDDVTQGGKRNALLIVVPSLDTGVCSLESQKFNTRIGELPPDVAAYVVSRDLPFAQARWAKEEGDVKLQLLSDYRDHSFGPAYGVLVKELGLLARSIFIIGKDKTIKYKQVVPEIGQEPNYEDVIAAASTTTSAVNA